MHDKYNININYYFLWHKTYKYASRKCEKYNCISEKIFINILIYFINLCQVFLRNNIKQIYTVLVLNSSHSTERNVYLPETSLKVLEAIRN